jgi:septal ring factor EnvC (AmiA/AmiB activator)
MAGSTAEEKNRPVTKVINLLKDMTKQLEKEAEEDEEVYNKVACWCQTNGKDKEKSISDAESSIDRLVTKIEEETASSSRLNTEIQGLEVEVAKNQKALDTATANRRKELAEFNEDEKDTLQSISALKSAVVVLSKHNGGAALLDMQAAMRATVHRHHDRIGDMLSVPEMKTVQSFLQAPEDYFDAEPTFKQSYAPQSGEIFGILKNMLSTFEADLAQAQKDEMQSQSAFEQLKAAKEDEIKQGQEHLDEKKDELANTDESLANAKEDLEDTRTTLAADQAFLANLKEKCQLTDQEYEERTKTRQEEISAVSEALSFLTSDEAHDLFSRTFNFVQRTATTVSANRERAAAILAKTGHRLGSAQLVILSDTVRRDAFVKVKKAIDDMIAKLLQDKEDEIKHKDFCIEELNTNERETDLKNRDKEDTQAKIDTLTNEIEQLTNEIDTLKAEIAATQTSLKRAGEDREQENKDFQETVADQRATVKLLEKTLDVLKGFYNKKHKGASLVQEDPAGPPPPPGFKAYSKNSGSGGVMGMIQQIINDAKVEEAEAIQAEKDAQAAYESFVKDSNDSITTKSDSIVDKSDTKAKKEGELTDSKKDLENIMIELEELANENADLHKACDFTLKNFDLRQEARDEEVEGLREAKAALNGAVIGFMQKQ